jgi:hypothetical protein
MDEMLHHVKAVARGAEHAMVVGDMPFMSFQASVEDGVRNAGRMIKEGGAHAVKVEGAQFDLISRLVEIGIPVMAHVGLTPQSVYGLGGMKVQGRGEAGTKVLEQAMQLEKAGAFAVVLEAMPAELGSEITRSLQIPTIGIGAGPGCDAQVLIIHDLLGIPKAAEAREGVCERPGHGDRGGRGVHGGRRVGTFPTKTTRTHSRSCGISSRLPPTGSTDRRSDSPDGCPARSARHVPRRGGLVVAAIGLATIGVHAHLSLDGRAAIDGSSWPPALAGAAVGFTRYRSTGTRIRCSSPPDSGRRDADACVRPELDPRPTMPWRRSRPRARVVLRLAPGDRRFVLARPWWTPRAQTDPRAARARGGRRDLFVIDLFWSCPPPLPHAKNADLRRDHAFSLTTRCLVGATIVLLIVAAWGMAFPRRRPLPHPWARYRLGDRRSGAGRDPGAAHLVPSVDRAGGLLFRATAALAS